MKHTLHNPNQAVALSWQGEVDGCLRLLDQTLLPVRTVWVDCNTVVSVVEAIASLRVRGAPAIGIAGAYGVVVAANEGRRGHLTPAALREHIRDRSKVLASARPTAINLRWAVDRMMDVLSGVPESATSVQIVAALLHEARVIHVEDMRTCDAIGSRGLSVLPQGGVLTHCNTGALATGGVGTALAIVTAAWQSGRRFEVYACETRPLFQGARLTSWELAKAEIPVTVIVDSAAAHVMKSGRVSAVVVGADRITACGDTANKIGTYGLAVLARAHQIPFFVAAPSTTFDCGISAGADIPIEERSPYEITHPCGAQTTAGGATVFNPAFDVTPASLITAIITERGIISPVSSDCIAEILGAPDTGGIEP